MKLCAILSTVVLCTFSLQAIENVTSKGENSIKEEFALKDSPKEESIETLHHVLIDGAKVQYKAIAGNLLLRNEKDQPRASIFYIAYFRDNIPDNARRPLIFCFNGGPGSSSVWLHMGLFGPRRVLLDGIGEGNPPYQFVNNEYSLLDIADLVFIDPVSTGYSRAAPGQDEKKFHEVDEDIESIGEFIRQFITKYERWDSPKLLAGESYGTARAAGLAKYLHDEQRIYLNGIILISSVLNFQTLYDYNKGNDLPYALYLPTYAAAAWYHKQLSPELQKDFNQTLEEVKQFALTDYTLALMKGNTLAKEENAKIVNKLSMYTGLTPEFIERSNLRVNPYRFVMELLRSKNLVLGRFDTRIIGNALDTSCDYPSYDPSFNTILGAFTAAFNQYLREELNVKTEQEYTILANIQSTWDYSKATNEFLNMANALHAVMIKNKHLKVFVGSGFFDLAAPFFATNYTFNHLRLVPSLQNNISKYYYHAGHVVFADRPSLIKMKNDLYNWLKTIK